MLYPYGHWVVNQLKHNLKKDSTFNAADATPAELQILREMVAQKVLARINEHEYVLVDGIIQEE